MPAPVLRQAQGEAFREWQTLVLSDRIASRTVNAVAPNAVDILGEGGLSVRVEFDDATGLPMRYVEVQPTVQTRRVESVDALRGFNFIWSKVGP